MGDDEISTEDFMKAQAQAVVKELAEAQENEYGYPEAPVKDSVFRFFRQLLGLTDSSKVANLSKDELGRLRLSVRAYQDVAAYAGAEGLVEVSKYLMKKGEIILSTSLGYKGFLPQLFVTQIKKDQKVEPKVEKKSWFGKDNSGEQRGGEVGG